MPSLRSPLARRAASTLVSVAVAHLLVRVGAGLNAWRVARGALRCRAVTDHRGRRVVYRQTVADATRRTLPAIICVPGLSVSSRYMVPLMHALAPHARVYCPHPPGHAGSDALPHVSVTAYARALLDWMEVMRLPPAVALVANSLGCQVALHVAAMAPERISQCVLIGPTADRRARHAVAQGLRLARSIPFDQRSIDLVVLADYVLCGPALALREVAAMLLDEPEQTARAVRCPVLLMRGEHDHVAPDRWLEELARATPAARLLTVPGAGHAVHYTRAAAVARHCVRFLRQIRPDWPAESFPRPLRSCCASPA